MSTYMDVTVGDPLTEREQQAVEIWEANGRSYKAVADAFNLTGGGREGNAGNYVRRALRKLGRADEIRQGGGGSTSTPRTSTTPTPKIPDAEQKIEDTLEQLRAEQDRLSTRLEMIQAESEMDDEAIFEAEVERLNAVVAEAQANLEKFQGMEDEQREQFTSQFRNRAQSARDREEQPLSDGLSTIAEAIEDNEVMLEALQARREKRAEEAEAAEAEAAEAGDEQGEDQEAEAEEATTS